MRSQNATTHKILQDSVVPVSAGLHQNHKFLPSEHRACVGSLFMGIEHFDRKGGVHSWDDRLPPRYVGHP